MSKGRVRGAALGLPTSGPGSVARVRTRCAGWLLDGLVTLPWTLLIYVAVRHPHFETLTRSNGSTHRHLATTKPPVLVGLLVLVPPVLYTIGLIAVRGRTIGEQLMGLRVVRIANLGPLVDPDPETRVPATAATAPGWRPSALRWVVLGWIAVGNVFHRLPVGLTGGLVLLVYLWACWDANGQGLHDKAAKVVVLRTRS